jgi:hypothetical protein
MQRIICSLFGTYYYIILIVINYSEYRVARMTSNTVAYGTSTQHDVEYDIQYSTTYCVFMMCSTQIQMNFFEPAFHKDMCSINLYSYMNITILYQFACSRTQTHDRSIRFNIPFFIACTCSNAVPSLSRRTLFRCTPLAGRWRTCSL